MAKRWHLPCKRIAAAGVLAACGLSGADTSKKAHSSWNDYLGGADSAQYSSLDQINKANVTQLEQVWFYPAGNNGFRFGFNPLVVDNTMYVLGKNNAVVALDARTGHEIWTHDNATREASPTGASTIGRAKIAAIVASFTPRTTICMRSTRALGSWLKALAITETSTSAKVSDVTLKPSAPFSPGRREEYSKTC